MVSPEETTPPAKSPPASMIPAPAPEAPSPEIPTPDASTPEATPPEIHPPEASTPEATPPEIPRPEASTREASPPEAPLTSDQPPGSQAAGYLKAKSVDGGKLNSGSSNENGSQRGDESGNEGSSRFSLTCYEILDTEDEGSEPEDPNRKRPFSEAFAGGANSDRIAPNIIPTSANVTNRTIGVNESQSGGGNGSEGSSDALDYYYARDYEYGYQKELNDLRRQMAVLRRANNSLRMELDQCQRDCEEIMMDYTTFVLRVVLPYCRRILELIAISILLFIFIIYWLR